MTLGWFRSLEISASGLTAERMRMDVIANNIANANTTRTAEGGPYRRRVTVLGARAEAQAAGFGNLLARAMQAAGVSLPGMAAPQAVPVGAGVRVAQVAHDQRPFRLKHDPTHPDANAEGYVQLPNVDPLAEMVDLISASRAYEANVTALNATKTIAARALEIGRS